MQQPQEFEYSIKYSSKYHGEWVRKARELIQAGGDRRALVRYDEETQENVHRWLKVYPDHRSFDNAGVALSITEHGVIIGLIHNNTTVVIRDTAFIDVMRRLFQSAYEDAGLIQERANK